MTITKFCQDLVRCKITYNFHKFDYVYKAEIIEFSTNDEMNIMTFAFFINDNIVGFDSKIINNPKEIEEMRKLLFQKYYHSYIDNQ